jgi:DNA-binding Lrp family transcriptional regulator
VSVMALEMAFSVLDEEHQRLIAALQCDGRVTAERVSEVLGLPTRVVQRRWTTLAAEGVMRVIATPPRASLEGVMLLRIKVLRGKLDVIAQALAGRDDIPFIDVSAGGDEISAIHLASPDPRRSLVFRQLPATTAVTSVNAQAVMHVYSDATDWRLDALSIDERRQLSPDSPRRLEQPLDDLDRNILTALETNARRSASSIARQLAEAESTIRRRLTNLLVHGHVITHVLVDPKRLGLAIDANLEMQVRPSRLDETGRRLAAHPAVHGALATTGPANLRLAVWLRDMDHLYQFITHDLAELEVDNVDTVLVGRAVKRLGVNARST